MADYFDDFEDGVRDELAAVMSESLDRHLNGCGVERGANGRFSVDPTQLFTATLGVTTDTVMFALRRYHEWTEASPR